MVHPQPKDFTTTRVVLTLLVFLAPGCTAGNVSVYYPGLSFHITNVPSFGLEFIRPSYSSVGSFGYDTGFVFANCPVNILRLGDQVCDADANVHACAWDSGDCAPNCPTEYIPYLGDDACHQSLNNANCSWDGGDCCQATCIEDVSQWAASAAKWWCGYGFTFVDTTEAEYSIRTTGNELCQDPEPLDCYGIWSTWGSCSQTCGSVTDGSVFRTREFYITWDAVHGGESCFDKYGVEAGGEMNQTTNCTNGLSACPVDCEGAWSAWTDCSSCDGSRNRTFHVTTVESTFGFGCEFVNGTVQTRVCDSCPVNCTGLWSEWSGLCPECNATKERTFNVVTDARNNGTECTNSTNATEIQQCALCRDDCPGDWLAWGQCLCEGGDSDGVATRTWSLDLGADEECLPYSDSTESEPCTCNIHCEGAWEGWSECSATCGSGQQYREFTVTQLPVGAGSSCAFDDGENQTWPCATTACPVDCAGNWGPWSACGSACGNSSRIRSYNVTVAASNGGQTCQEFNQVDACVLDCCDHDQDGVCDLEDSCAYDADNDADGDALCAYQDSCPYDGANDADSDNICSNSDSCEFDSLNDVDSDMLCGNEDSCTTDPENDADGDALCGNADSCPHDADNDIDSDSICADDDSCIMDALNDIDSDSICGDVDSCPNIAENDPDGDGDCGSLVCEQWTSSLFDETSAVALVAPLQVECLDVVAQADVDVFDLDCEADFWTPWSPCNSSCTSVGIQRRLFRSDQVTTTKAQLFVAATLCDQYPSTRVCNNAANCDNAVEEAARQAALQTGLGVGLPLIFVLVALGIFFLYSSVSTGVLIRNRLYHTKLGHECIEFSAAIEGLTAEQLYSTISRLKSRYPDFTNDVLWEALDYGIRGRKEAAGILTKLEDLSTTSSDTSESIETAVAWTELAESSLDSVQELVYQQVPDLTRLEELFDNGYQFDFTSDMETQQPASAPGEGTVGLKTPSPMFIAVMVPWADMLVHQREVVRLLLQRAAHLCQVKFEDDFPFTLAVRNKFPAPVLLEMLRSFPPAVATCTVDDLLGLVGLGPRSDSDGGGTPMAESNAISSSKSTECLALVSLWIESSLQNKRKRLRSAPGEFVPPCVIAAELKVFFKAAVEQPLSNHNKSSSPSSDADESDSSSSLSSSAAAKRKRRKRKKARKKKQPGYMRMTSSTSMKQKPKQPKFGSKRGAVVPVGPVSKTKAAKSASRGQKSLTHGPCSEAFLAGTSWIDIAAAEAVMAECKTFLQEEVTHANGRAEILRQTVAKLSSGFSDIYHAIARRFIKTDPQFEPCQTAINGLVAMSAKTHASSPVEKAALLQHPEQKSKSIVEMYHYAADALKGLREILQEVERRMPRIEAHAAPLKSVYRVMEKIGLRSVPDWTARHILDVVRGHIIVRTMADMTECIAFLAKHKQMRVVRVKNRFQEPTAGGWMDCLLNFYLVSDPTAHVCELQIVHHKLMLARAGMAGHDDYVILRAAEELLATTSPQVDSSAPVAQVHPEGKEGDAPPGGGVKPSADND